MDFRLDEGELDSAQEIDNFLKAITASWVLAELFTKLNALHPIFGNILHKFFFRFLTFQIFLICGLLRTILESPIFAVWVRFWQARLGFIL